MSSHEDPISAAAPEEKASQEAVTVHSSSSNHSTGSSNDIRDERMYKTRGEQLIEKRRWKEAIRELHCRLYFLEMDTNEYKETLDMIYLARRHLLVEVMPIPVVFKEMLFLRNIEEKWSKWISQMGYTEHMVNFNQSNNAIDYRGSTMFTKIALKQGSLVMRIQPFATSPWSMETRSGEDGEFQVAEYTSCFHCLCTINHVSDLYYENNTLIACPCNPYECPYAFCSEECFLNNGAVHTLECEYLVKLKSFAVNMLNETFVLLVVRTLIRCGLCRDINSHKPVEISGNTASYSSDDILQRILDFKVNYSLIEKRHKSVLEDIQTFAHFLLNELGGQFCLFLTHRELVHLIVVLWTKSLAISPEIYIGSESIKLGGVAFSIDFFNLQQSVTPTLSVNFDSDGKISIRSIYAMEPGTRLYINTALDKYLPSFKQNVEFWSVGLYLSSEMGDAPVVNKMPGICSIRCSSCITSFCHVERVNDATSMSTAEYRMQNQYVWSCERCSTLQQDDLNMLQSKAEDTLRRVHRLKSCGHYLTAKKILEGFLWRWAGVLHTNHYLLYNAHVMLAGINMNKAGSNITEALIHLTAAVLMAEEMMPLVCHEKAHLYSRLADLMGQLVLSDRVNRKENIEFKKMTMEAAYAALWNWTVLAGAGSREALSHMQKCRSLAFQMNIHVPSLSTHFVINVPGRYMEIFKLVTGKCVIPSIHFSSRGKVDVISPDNVATVAFMAAQSGVLDDGVLELLMSVESRGIVHMGTGLSIMGIAASNGNVELVKAITESIVAKVAKTFDFLTKNETTDEAEETIVNLIISLVGGNELGITPLMAMASVPVDSNTQAIKNEIIICRLMFECADKLDDIIAKYKGDIEPRLASLMWLLSSDVSVKSLILDARTHNFFKCQTCLHYAASKGKRNLVQYLARVSGNVNQINLDGATPLHLAALGGHLEVCETLISFGAKQNIPLNTGELPIHLAIYALDEKTVKLLLEPYVRQTSTKDTTFRSFCSGDAQKRGPSIWHALVSGIYRPTPDSPNGCTLALDVLVTRLAKAVQIAQYLAEHTSAKEAYVWSNTAPSQVLCQKWQDYMEANSNRFDPRENFKRLNVSNVNAVLQKGRAVSEKIASDCIFNDDTDAIFAVTRAIQFLTQLLRRAEDGTSDSTGRHMGVIPTPTETR
uniref:Ankyrin repeat domain containing protein n=2 Tax=Babesia bovis TaxID=5865 RepID=A7AX02_BABBO|eukprot:XP_001609148.1 ankyrin repeat domain containing protein [Babesia bovis T2Bo]